MAGRATAESFVETQNAKYDGEKFEFDSEEKWELAEKDDL